MTNAEARSVANLRGYLLVAYIAAVLCGFLFEITAYAGHNTLSHRPQTVSQAYDSGDPIDVWRLQLEPERTTRPRYSMRHRRCRWLQWMGYLPQRAQLYGLTGGLATLAQRHNTWPAIHRTLHHFGSALCVCIRVYAARPNAY